MESDYSCAVQFVIFEGVVRYLLRLASDVHAAQAVRHGDAHFSCSWCEGSRRRNAVYPWILYLNPCWGFVGFWQARHEVDNVLW